VPLTTGTAVVTGRTLITVPLTTRTTVVEVATRTVVAVPLAAGPVLSGRLLGIRLAIVAARGPLRQLAGLRGSLLLGCGVTGLLLVVGRRRAPDGLGHGVSSILDAR